MTVFSACQAVGISRQSYYKGRKERQEQQVNESLIVELVKCERLIQPQIGTRKLYVILADKLQSSGIQIGRDRFFDVLRKHDLLINRRRRRGPQTTDSRHYFRKFPNLLKDRTLTGAHQAWVCDITYVRTDEGFAYVSLVSDVWSHKIIGYQCSDHLDASGSINAVRMALRQLRAGCYPLHHSDRGIQYCCSDYMNCLQEHNIPVSMTEENHCYENAQAERLNGILKQEYGLGETFRTKQQVRDLLKEAVHLYNTRRPHISLNYQTPAKVHQEAV